MQTICTLLQTDNTTNISSLNFLQAGCSSWRPTNNVKALKTVNFQNSPEEIISHLLSSIPSKYACFRVGLLYNVNEFYVFFLRGLLQAPNTVNCQQPKIANTLTMIKFVLKRKVTCAVRRTASFYQRFLRAVRQTAPINCS